MDATSLVYKIYTDGGSRGNPGPAAYGFVVYDAHDAIIYEAKQPIGMATNNQAEYQGIVAALRYAQTLDFSAHTKIVCYLDSQLIVRQVNGQYKMKSEELRPWLEEVRTLVDALPVPVNFIDVRREQNKYADKLVNEALDGVDHV